MNAPETRLAEQLGLQHVYISRQPMGRRNLVRAYAQAGGVGHRNDRDRHGHYDISDRSTKDNPLDRSRRAGCRNYSGNYRWLARRAERTRFGDVARLLGAIIFLLCRRILRDDIPAMD